MALTKFVRTSVAALGALALISQANAADIYSGGGGLKDVPYIPPPMWTGFYIGAHLGADWANRDRERNVFNDNIVTSPGVDPTFFAPFDNKLSSTGAFGGAQFGYNWQTSCCFVFGIEVDLGGFNNEDRRTVTASTMGLPGVPLGLGHVATFNVREEGGFYGDVTGRIGYTFSGFGLGGNGYGGGIGGGSAMIYAKGGFAFFDPNFKVRTVLMDGAGAFTTFDNNNNNNNTQTGWTVGGGIEWMLNPNWTLKVEYLHFDFSNNERRFAFGPVDGVFTTANDFRFGRNDLTVDTVKLGFNYLLTRAPAPIPLK
jgi:outer membrane immunogenic protein